jgi:predicted XRE-type DNA-binding protein
MLTLKELRKMVSEAETKAKVPTAKSLLESGVPIVVKEVFDAETEIMVFENGYVLYHVGKYATVFPLHSCGNYTYSSVMKAAATVKRDVFDNENWYIRLMLEGEDRLEHNQDNRTGQWCLSYSAVAEDWAPLGIECPVLEMLVREETTKEVIEEILSLVTQKQGYVLMRQYIDQIEQSQLAKELGVTQQAISDMIRKAKKRIVKAYSAVDSGKYRGMV